MFPIKARDLLPVDKILIHSVAVRGQLGPMTVWVSEDDTEGEDNNSNSNNNRGGARGGGAGRRRGAGSATATGTARRSGIRRILRRRANNDTRARDDNNNDVREYNFRLSSRHWKKVYEATHGPSLRKYRELKLTEPIALRPGQVRAIYVHSELQGDEAIVYDNSQTVGHGNLGFGAGNNNGNGPDRPRVEDKMIRIMSGKSHLSCVPFGQVPIWGWGNAWRDRREFVGRIEYGCVYKLWNPDLNVRMGDSFRSAVEAVLGCRHRSESPWSLLPDECVYYVLNMCHWSWFGDDEASMKRRRAVRKRAARQRQALLLEQRQSEDTKEPANEDGEDDDDDEPYDADLAAGSDEDDDDASMLVDDDGADEDVQVEAMDLVADRGSAGNNDNIREEEDDDDDDDGDDDDDDSEESEWERANGYRADTSIFTYRDVSSDDEGDDETGNSNQGDNNSNGRGGGRVGLFFARTMARAHVLRALARMDGGDDDDEEDTVDMDG